MLIKGSKAPVKITYKDVEANATSGKAYWEAVYMFSKTGRPVHNKIHASFLFKDGKIIQHTDKFNFFNWSCMAFGPLGWLLGWTPILKNKVRSTALSQLEAFKKK
jgi:hypothetical protein